MKTILQAATLLSLAMLKPNALMAQWQAPVLPGQKRALPTLTIGRNAKGSPARGNQPQVVWNDAVTLSSPATANISNAESATYTGRKLFGALVSSQEWSGMSLTQVPYGIYSFEMGETPQPTCHIWDMSYDFMSGAWGRNRHFGQFVMNVMGAINGTRNILIDTQSWREKSNIVVDPTNGTYSLVLSVLTYDPSDDHFYGFRYKQELNGLDWVRVNEETAELEMIASYRGSTAVLALAAGPDGTMYYVDVDGDLYTMNKNNGRSTLVGNTGVSPTAYNQSMTWDWRTGRLLWAAQSSEGSVLYSIDPLTAETERVLRFKHNEQFVSLYQTEIEAPDMAPAAVTRPQLTYSANGLLDGTISFNVPQRTYNGSTLEGDINLNVWLDGENLQGVLVNAGQKISLPVSLSEGNHYVAITLDNEAGFSPLRQIYQYAGYDFPEAPENVVFEQSEGVNSLSWKAPTLGVNRGYMDLAGLTYDIVRMPDSVLVATGITETSWSEPTPRDMRAYYYRVIADNQNHKSDFGQSNRILCGDSFTVPYQQSFADPVTLSDYFTVVDANNDGKTWRQGYTTEVRLDYYSPTSDADDWLISPAIQLEGQKMYRFLMEMKNYTVNYPEDFEILIGTDPQDLSTFRLIKSEEHFTKIATEFGDYIVNFLVEETGNYHMAVRYCTKMDEGGSLMMIHDMRVEFVGNALSPAQPSELAISADAEGAQQATLQLVAPTSTLNGQSLSSLSRIDVKRNGELVHSFEAPAPGEALTWTDEAVPYVGLHTYTLVAVNEAGEGESLSQTIFVGIYSAPYEQDFENRSYAELWTSEKLGIDDPNNWNGWKWTDNKNTYGRHWVLDYYSQVDGEVNMWLYTPLLKMQKDVVYTIKYDANMNYRNWADVSYNIFKGHEANHEAMTEWVAEMPTTGYGLFPQELFMVSTEDGNFHLGIDAMCSQKYSYMSAAIDNFSFTYRTSAFAPYKMQNYKSVAKANGDLQADLSFRAPRVNYYQENLDPEEELVCKIYHDRDMMKPVTTINVLPGKNVSWTDTDCMHGLNYYTITCENSHGKGEVIHDTIFVGRDIPALVNNFKIRGSKDNLDAEITWSAPTVGNNGGVVIKSEMTYNVYAYDPTTNNLTLLADKLSECKYTVKREDKEQYMDYYAVSATMETEGEGPAIASQILLGRLYELPFRESFANSMSSTQLWQSVPMQQYATSAGIDNPDGTYSGCSTTQDDDEGCAYIFNGNQYEIYTGAILAAPKVKLLAGAGNELHFWAYHFISNSGYQNPATLQVIISADDTQYANINNATYTLTKKNATFGEESGWREHVVNLDAYMHSDFVSVGFMGVTGGYMEVIYLDNISIVNVNAEGIQTVTDDRTVSRVNFYDASGREVIMPHRGGVYIRTTTYEDGTQKSEKIVK